MNETKVQTTKRCSKCREEKPATREFWYRHRSAPLGLTRWCRRCTQEADQARRVREGRVPVLPIGRRLWEQVVIGGKDECWPFVGRKNRAGYGVMCWHAKDCLAHRVAKALALGFGRADFPECVLHKCDNPPCCNPGHLFLGTTQDNTRDMISKGRHRAVRGDAHGAARLSERDARDVLDARRRGVPRADLARHYRVNYTTIYRLEIGRLWRHIPR